MTETTTMDTITIRFRFFMGFVHFTECFSATKEFWLNHKRIRKKLKEYGYKPETIDIINDFYTR